MQQHINLISQLDRKVEPLLSAKQQSIALAAVCVLMVMVAVGNLFVNRSMVSDVKQIKQQQQASAQQLESLKAKKARLLQDKTILQSVEKLNQDIAFRRQLLATIDPDAFVGKNFSEHLIGLARQHIDGMWFTEIHVQNGGGQLALSGLSRRPELLPKYLRNLSNEEIFRGQRFRLFRMNTPESGEGALSFELRADEVEQTNE